ncbi:hypothetical protein QTP88_024675 [Uroleucon formosanum]
MTGPFQQSPTNHIEQFWMAFGTFKKKFQQMAGPFQQRPTNHGEQFCIVFYVLDLMLAVGVNLAADRFHDANWLVNVAYVCDVFEFLNNLNLVFQGNYEAFTMLTAFQKENNISFMPQDTSVLIQKHLQGLEANLKEHFPLINSNKAWIRNPFLINIKTTFSDLNVELSCDTALKDMYKERLLIDFWLSSRQEYPVLAEQAIQFLIPFVTTYKCEAGF